MSEKLHWKSLKHVKNQIIIFSSMILDNLMRSKNNCQYNGVTRCHTFAHLISSLEIMQIFNNSYSFYIKMLVCFKDFHFENGHV